MNKQQIRSIAELLTIERLLVFSIFLSLFIAVRPYNPDVYLHLTTGRYIFEHGELPQFDIFSYTKYGEQWILHEWLYQLLIYIVNNAFGATGLQAFASILITSTLIVTKRSCELLGSSVLVSWMTAIALFLAWLPFISTRPQIITYLFLSFSLHAYLQYRLKGSSKALYTLPPIMLLWVNSHGGFLIGIILLGYAVFFDSIEKLFYERRWHLPNTLLYILALTLIASIANPNGIHQLLFPFQLMDQWMMNYIGEWRSPDFSRWNYALYAILIAILIFTSFALRQGKPKVSILFVTPFILASFDSVRHIPIAAIIVTPFLAYNITILTTRLKRGPRRVTPTTKVNQSTQATNNNLGVTENILNWMLLCCLAITFIFSAPKINNMKQQTYEASTPIGATKYLIESNIQGRMFTPIIFSDYILYHRYPEQKLFYDVRAEIYGKDLSRDYMKMVYAQDNWLDLFRKHKIDYVVLWKKQLAYNDYIDSGHFHSIYADKYSNIMRFSPLEQ